MLPDAFPRSTNPFGSARPLGRGYAVLSLNGERHTMNAISEGSAPALVFHETTFHPVEHAGKPWLTAAEIAQALGYAREDSIGRIYERRKDEFTPGMTLTAKLAVKGFGSGESEKDVRIFSLRGAHLVAMFARTERAAEFRRWVLDVLDREVGATPKQPLSISDYMRMGRWCMHVDLEGRLIMSPLPEGAFVISAHEIASVIAEPMSFPRELLPGIIDVAVKRLAR